MVFSFPFSNLARRLQTVHLGHLDVHEDHVVLIGFELIQREFAVLRELELAWFATQIGADQ